MTEDQGSGEAVGQKLHSKRWNRIRAGPAALSCNLYLFLFIPHHVRTQKQFLETVMPDPLGVQAEAGWVEAGH
jgi:hypothetical protein